MPSTREFITAARTAPSDSDRYTVDSEGEEALHYLQLFAIVLATIAIIVIVIRVIPLITNALFALSHKVRERKERRRAAEDEEKALELGARSATDAVGGQKALVGPAREVRQG